MRLLAIVAALLTIGVGSALADDGVGFVDPATGEWYLPGQDAFYFGNPGDTPFTGDWNCDGTVTPGLHRAADGFVYLRDSNSQGIADRRFFFGNPDDVPIAGDWDGDGCDTVSLWRPSENRVYIIDRLGSEATGLGAADYFFSGGGSGEVPFAFDDDGDGADSVAFHDRASGLVTINGVASYFGNPGDVVVTGRWEGPPALGVFRPAERRVFAAVDCRAGQRTWHPVTAAAPAPSVGATMVELGVEERKALGPGIGVQVEWAGGATLLTDCAPAAAIGAPVSSVITVSYLSARGLDAAVTWDQVVTGPGIEISQPWRDEAAAPDDIVLAWQATSSSSTYLSQLDAAPGLTVTSPIWWRLAADGSITGSGDAAFVTSAHGRGIDVWPAIASLDADRIHAAMADPDALATQLSALAAATGADGINIDLEGFRFEDAAAVTQFSATLSELVHAWEGVTSFDITPRADDWDITSIDFDALFWSQAPDRRGLAAAVDYLILMAYDEHNAHRPAGPVASPHWVEDVTRYLLRYTDADRLILGMPFYGRLWGPGLFDTPRAIGIGSLTASESSGTRSYDFRFGLDRVDFSNGTYLWSETPAGLAHRAHLADELGLAGVAAWRLGFDSSAIWPVLSP